VRIPTFSRQSDTTTETAERPPVAPRTEAAPKNRSEDPTLDMKPVEPKTKPLPPPPPAATKPAASDTAKPTASDTVSAKPVAPVKKARASLLATLGLGFSVAGALFVLSGPLMGYGVGLAGLAFVLSIAGLHATGKRHVAGKPDALIGLIVSLGAIVVGVLGLTGSLSWLGTDAQTVNITREWLDTQFIDRF
jgi:hypothetical protein